MNFFFKTFYTFSLICLLGCSVENSELKREESDDDPISEIESKEAIEGIRIAWDYNTNTLMSEENDKRYNGYPRLIQLQDESLLVVYELKGVVIVKKSSAIGENWSDIITLVEHSEGVNMATPDILQIAKWVF